MQKSLLTIQLFVCLMLQGKGMYVRAFVVRSNMQLSFMLGPLENESSDHVYCGLLSAEPLTWNDITVYKLELELESIAGEASEMVVTSC